MDESRDEIEKICSNLERMSGSVADAVERQVLIEAKRIQADAKRLVTVITGRLRESITADVTRELNGDIVGTVGTNVSYAAVKEYGSGPVGKASDKMLPEGVSPKYRDDGWVYQDPKTEKFIYTEGQPAQPFLYPAFKLNEHTAAENIKKAAMRAVMEELKNG